MLVLFFFFNDTATTEIYTLSLHDALPIFRGAARRGVRPDRDAAFLSGRVVSGVLGGTAVDPCIRGGAPLAAAVGDRKSTRLNSSHGYISYAVFCLKKKNMHRSTNALLDRP